MLKNETHKKYLKRVFIRYFLIWLGGLSIVGLVSFIASFPEDKIISSWFVFSSMFFIILGAVTVAGTITLADWYTNKKGNAE